MVFAGRPAETDLSPARWIAVAALPPGEDVVGSLVPPVFPGYARLFHPAARYVGDADVDVTWAEVAAANGRAAHPAMAWSSITGGVEYFDEADQSPLWDGAPPRGHLPEQVARRLAAVLSRHTTTPDDCFFGIAADFGFLPAGMPTVPAAGSRHALVRGPVALAAANMADEPWDQSPSMWWPADHAWFVATGIDLVTTYVGGSRACIGGLLAAEDLEVTAVPAGQPIGEDADTINPVPERG